MLLLIIFATLPFLFGRFLQWVNKIGKECCKQKVKEK